ncbi:MAG: hypothetical protein WC810_24635 [Janthinobacterium sp.]|jgi:hypothetical protein
MEEQTLLMLDAEKDSDIIKEIKLFKNGLIFKLIKNTIEQMNKEEYEGFERAYQDFKGLDLQISWAEHLKIYSRCTARRGLIDLIETFEEDN